MAVSVNFGSYDDVKKALSDIFGSASATIGDIAIQFDVDVDVLGAMRQEKDYSEETIQKMFQEQAYYGAKALIESAQNTISGWLAPAGESKTSVGIGFTGKASRNFEIKTDKNAQGAFAYLLEGDLTTANKQIRFGRAKGSDSDDLDTLRSWAKYRGLKYNYIRTGKRRKSKSGRPKRNHTENYWNERLSYALRGGLKLHGASVEYGKFDYIKQYISRGDAKQSAQYLLEYGLPDSSKPGGKIDMELISGAFYSYLASEFGKAKKTAVGQRHFSRR